MRGSDAFRWSAVLGAALLCALLGAPSRAADAGRVYFAGSPHPVRECDALAPDPSSDASPKTWAREDSRRVYRALARHPFAVGFGSPGSCPGDDHALPVWLHLRRRGIPGDFPRSPRGGVWGN